MEYSRRNRDCFALVFEEKFGSREACEVNFERQRKITILASISRDIWSLKTRGRVENVHVSLQLLNK